MSLFASSSTTSRPHVLVVDDNPDNIILLQYLLDEFGYTTCIADGGRAALAMLESHRPDLILLDLMMTDMDGIQVARYIRAIPCIQHIPIVLVAAYTDELEGKDCSLFNQILAKPIEENQLLSLLNSMIKYKPR